jgi:hypothetical protein
MPQMPQTTASQSCSFPTVGTYQSCSVGNNSFVIGGATALAAPVVGTAAATGALLVGAAVGAAVLGNDIYNNYVNRNSAGLAYDAGSVLGGALGGYLTGGSTANGIKSGASRGWSFARDIANRWRPSLGLNPIPWLATGPDAAAAGGGQAGSALAVPRKRC